MSPTRNPNLWESLWSAVQEACTGYESIHLDVLHWFRYWSSSTRCLCICSLHFELFPVILAGPCIVTDSYSSVSSSIDLVFLSFLLSRKNDVPSCLSYIVTVLNVKSKCWVALYSLPKGSLVDQTDILWIKRQRSSWVPMGDVIYSIMGIKGNSADAECESMNSSQLKSNDVWNILLTGPDKNRFFLEGKLYWWQNKLSW